MTSTERKQFDEAKRILISRIDSVTIGQVRTISIPVTNLTNEQRWQIEQILKDHLSSEDCKRLHEFEIKATIKIN